MTAVSGGRANSHLDHPARAGRVAAGLGCRDKTWSTLPSGHTCQFSVVLEGQAHGRASNSCPSSRAIVVHHYSLQSMAGGRHNAWHPNLIGEVYVKCVPNRCGTPSDEHVTSPETQISQVALERSGPREARPEGVLVTLSIMIVQRVDY